MDQSITLAEAVRAFNRWMAGYIEDPARFQALGDAIARFKAETNPDEAAYGRDCAAHLFALAQDGTPKEPWTLHGYATHGNASDE